jgi:hypothetical protein
VYPIPQDYEPRGPTGGDRQDYIVAAYIGVDIHGSQIKRRQRRQQRAPLTRDAHAAGLLPVGHQIRERRQGSQGVHGLLRNLRRAYDRLMFGCIQLAELEQQINICLDNATLDPGGQYNDSE